jgi:hypothetical protein
MYACPPDYDEGAADALMGLAGYRGLRPASPVERLDPDQITSKIVAPSQPEKPAGNVITLKRSNASPSPNHEGAREPAQKRQRVDVDDASRLSTPGAQSPLPAKARKTVIEVLNPPRVPSPLPSGEGGSSASSPDKVPAAAPPAAEDGEIDEIEEPEQTSAQLPAPASPRQVNDKSEVFKPETESRASPVKADTGKEANEIIKDVPSKKSEEVEEAGDSKALPQPREKVDDSEMSA